MPDAQSEVGNFIAQADQVIPQAGSVLGELPLVPFQTALKLTHEQEKRMIEHAFKRKQQLEVETGRENSIQPNWWMNSGAGAGNSTALQSQGLMPYETFLGKRCRYDATFANDVAWRPFMFGPENIFYTSNIPVPVVRRVARQMIARAKNKFFGEETDHWFSINPAPVPEYDPQRDAERADKIEKFCRFKLGEDGSDSKESSGRAISRALILGEAVVKTGYVVRDSLFNTEARVLHGVDGSPVRAADGNFITEEDRWVDAEDGLGTMLLERDMETEQPVAPIYQQIPLDRRMVLFEGARSEVVYYKDWLCPLTASSVQDADCCVHLYDKPVFEFVDLVVKRGLVDDTSEGRLLAAQKMIALIKKLASNNPMPKSASTLQTRANDNYITGPSVETGGPISEFAEFYMWYDANGDGVAENIMLICDRVTRAPIFYDYVANVTTDGLRPLQVVRVNPVEGRWYGVGIMELFESYQNIIDLLVNRWNFSQSRAGRVDFWSPTMTQEGDRDPNLKMNYGGSYTIKPGLDPEQALHSVYLNDIKFTEIQTMFQFFLQLLYNESGVTTANDGEAAGASSSELATGLIQNQESGDELFKPTIQDLKPGIRGILAREVDVTLANMNPVEVFTYLEGNTEGIDRLTPNDVRGLKFKVKIALSTQDDQRKIQLSAAASSLVEKFYMLAPQVQVKVAPFYRDQVRRLAPNVDVNSVIDPVQPTAPQEEAPRKSVSVSIKGEDLSPGQREELLREDFDVQAAAGASSGKNGSVEKLGSREPNTQFETQLTQRMNKAATPSAN
jgi:hypothetical protein